MSKNDGRRGTFEENLQGCIFRGKCNTKDMFMRDVRRSGRCFPEKGSTQSGAQGKAVLDRKVRKVNHKGVRALASKT